MKKYGESEHIKAAKTILKKHKNDQSLKLSTIIDLICEEVHKKYIKNRTKNDIKL